MRDQLRALEDSQNAARDLLGGLQTRPEDHTRELAARLPCAENLIQILMDQSHPRGPEILPPSRTVSICQCQQLLLQAICRSATR